MTYSEVPKQNTKHESPKPPILPNSHNRLWCQARAANTPHLALFCQKPRQPRGHLFMVSLPAA
ncbi:MAG: hypothetical protein ORN98_05660 [Alphaproteobacteria bacterium]|nr:hypothetical protein [Alphaproteobacteria bacterium]